MNYYFKKLYFFIIIFFLIYFSPKALCNEIKIGLISTSGQVKITANEKANLINLFNNKLIYKTKKNESLLIENIDGLISIKDKNNNKLGAFTVPIKLIPTKKNSLVSCKNQWYRGTLSILINNNKKNITVVNNVDLEDYLLSVVPSEIPYTWHKEVLKAQSVASRSYAVGYLGRRISKGYDLEATVEDQMYLGIKSEKKSTRGAVKETSGIILLDKDNKPLIALYHSSGGGYTDSIENLWETNEIKPSTHIQPRPDYDDYSPHFKWYRNYKLNNLNGLLSNLNTGTITNIVPLSKSISGRVTWIKITGKNGDSTIRGEQFRKYLKLPSSKFNLSIKNDDVNFAGRGYGHGLGLSQWGAKALAENGFTYEQILAHYYPGARLTRIEDW